MLLTLLKGICAWEYANQIVNYKIRSNLSEHNWIVTQIEIVIK